MKDKLELPNVLLALRKELQEAQDKAADENLKFSLEEIELEIQVIASTEETAKHKVKLWVYEAGAEGTVGKETVHKVKLKMKPQNADGSDVNIAGRAKKPK